MSHVTKMLQVHIDITEVLHVGNEEHQDALQQAAGIGSTTTSDIDDFL